MARLYRSRQARKSVRRVPRTSRLASMVAYDTLESRQLLAAVPIITEFMASNRGTILDGNGKSSDWIELHNAGDEPVNLFGYSLTDDAADPGKFVLPTRILDPGAYLVVYASGDNTPDAAQNIHTNFKLSATGEYVGFFDPSGTLLSEFGVGGNDYPGQATDISFGLNIVVAAGVYITGSQRYFIFSTPGAVNTPNTADLAPVITGVEKPTEAAVDGQDIVVTARPITPTSTLTAVQLHARVNYSSEVTITMLDDGTGGDAVANDGTYTGTISSSLFDEGDMVRWRITATAANGFTGKGPTFLSSSKSPEYYGTVVADSSIETPLPVIQWFTNNVGRATGSGARGSVFYNGEFYDNIFMRKRGQSSNNSPKKNLKFDFNPGDRFLLEPGMKRVDELNLNNTYYDQADVRATLASEVFQAAGLASPITFPIQTRLNGDFYSLSIYVEQVDADFLDRNGLDPNGALYKVDGGTIGNNGFNPDYGLSGFLKRTRLFEGNSELQELADAVNENLPQEQRAAYLYDHVDIFSVINYMAGSAIFHNADQLGKNHYVYQDTDGTGKWSFLPWDLDLTFGKNGASTPDIEGYQADISDQSNNAYPNSHPFFGSSEYPRFSVSHLYNRLIDAVLDTPELREIYLRRLRSVMDTILQSPGSAILDRKLEARLVELLPLIQADWTADDAKWIEAPQTNLSRGTDWGEDLALSEHFQRLVDRYLDPRREFLYNFHNIANAGVALRLIETTDQARYIVPTSEISNWQATTFDDDAWGVGNQSFGYDRGTGYGALIQTNLETQLYSQLRSIYTRTEFNIDSANDLNSISSLFLDVRYDDGFIAYINGIEVARSSNVTGNGLTAVSTSHEASGPVRFTLTQTAINALNVGNNVLAVHAINSSTTSSDMLLQVSLVGSDGGDPEIAGIPNEQVLNPPISFDLSDFDTNPISGVQGQEYLRLNNANTTPVDISGWRLAGGVDLTFRPGTVIPAGGKLFAVASVVDFLARSSGPGASQNLLTHGDYSGQLGIGGETVQLIAADGTVMDTFDVPATTGTDVQSFLRVTEIGYHPVSATGAEEFIEFTNISSGGSSTTLDLSGVTITDGPGTPYVFEAGVTLGPGQRIVVVKDVGAFTARYPSVPVSQIVGQYGGSLSNSGERLRVEDAGGNTVVDINYGDDNPWPVVADGNGGTLELVSETTTPFEQLGKYYSWQGSISYGGTPGTARVEPSGIVVNEVLAHTDAPLVDSIELYNPTSDPIDVGDWYLSDSASNPLKFQIPSNTVIAAGDYLVLDENAFNPTPGNPAANHFALSGSLGDQVYLTQAVGGFVSRFEDVVAFGATFTGESLGRIPSGTGPLTRLATGSFHAPNGAARVGPLLISEINYHPTEPLPSAIAMEPAIAVGDLEFVEIHNPSTSSVNLTNWRLRGEVDLDLPAISLAADTSLVLVSFDPAAAFNANLLAAFKAHYGITGGQFAGPFLGSLSNSFARVSLQQPDAPPIDNPMLVPRVVVDEVVYDDLVPWADADGSGLSLNRSSSNSNGHLPASWSGNAPTPGSANLAASAPGVVEVLRDGGATDRPDLWNSLEVVFDTDVNVDQADLLLYDDTQGGILVSPPIAGFSYHAASLTATWTFDSSNPLPAAYYSYALNANSITASVGGLALDGNGNGSAGGDYVDPEYVAIPGDANLDGDVDISDFNPSTFMNDGDASILLGSLGTSSGATWANGDFNGDGDVDVSQFDVSTLTNVGDASILLANLGQNVRPAAATTLVVQSIASAGTAIASEPQAVAQFNAVATNSSSPIEEKPLKKRLGKAAGLSNLTSHAFIHRDSNSLADRLHHEWNHDRINSKTVVGDRITATELDLLFGSDRFPDLWE